ncbi:RlpA-like double-psi beta-barrel-protein domain-containing protein-containing protein [Phellopilus nigrolimitatus]|nr:RlpA-like double-psi beta-barrel-protein domain-containing protein-containing protein [Phellopilus nigrolimitatus]
MRLSFILSAIVLPLAVTAASHKARHSKRHHDLAARESKPLEPVEPVESVAAAAVNATNATEHTLSKRFSNARFTFYDVGLGACGKTNSPSDFIVALNTPQYGSGSPGPQCFKMISITYNGKTTQAQIMDECPGCPYGGLDMSDGLFDFFADASEGVIYGTWEFTDGSGGGGGSSSSSSSSWSSSSPAWKPPTSTWTPPSTTWKPSSTWTPPSSTWSSSSSKWSSSSTWSSSSSSWSPTSTWSSSSSTPSTTSTSTATSTASYDLSSGPASGLAEATGSQALTPSQAASENIYAMNLGVIGLGGLVAAGANAN